MEQAKQELSSIAKRPIAWLKQTHSSTCVLAKENIIEADASINFDSSFAFAVLTADCVPIILTDTTGSFTAAIHAGWRGIASGIIEGTLAKITSDNVIAWIGPSICSECYKVTSEFQENFKIPKFKSCFSQNSTFDLKQACKIILAEHNISKTHESSFCTSCNNDLFFSARREGISCSRIITCIWR